MPLNFPVISRSSSSQASSSNTPVYHAATAKPIIKPTSRPSISTQNPSSDQRIHGVPFSVNFDHVYLRRERLIGSRLGFSVRYKSLLGGGRPASSIWKYGVELIYRRPDNKELKIWLCRACHLNRSCNDAYTVDCTAHIVRHMVKEHRIHPNSGALPDAAVPVKVLNVAGSGTIVTHTPWQEAEFQSALVNWVITRDVSFFNAISPATRGLLTWNQRDLLKPYPTHHLHFHRISKKRWWSGNQSLVSYCNHLSARSILVLMCEHHPTTSAS